MLVNQRLQLGMSRVISRKTMTQRLKIVNVAGFFFLFFFCVCCLFVKQNTQTNIYTKVSVRHKTLVANNLMSTYWTQQGKKSMLPCKMHGSEKFCFVFKNYKGYRFFVLYFHVFFIHVGVMCVCAHVCACVCVCVVSCFMCHVCLFFFEI